MESALISILLRLIWSKQAPLWSVHLGTRWEKSYGSDCETSRYSTCSICSDSGGDPEELVLSADCTNLENGRIIECESVYPVLYIKNFPAVETDISTPPCMSISSAPATDKTVFCHETYVDICVTHWSSGGFQSCRDNGFFFFSD